MRARKPILLIASLCAFGLQAPAAGAAERSWSSPAALSGHANAAGFPQVSLAEDGDAISIWNIGYGVEGAARAPGVRPLLSKAHEVVQTAIRPDGGSYGAAQTLSDTESNAYSAGIGTAADGEAIAVWTQDQEPETTPGERSEIEYAIRPAGAGAFGTAKVLSVAGVAGEGASIAMNPAGEAIVVWLGAEDTEIQYATRSAGGAFGAVTSIKPGAGISVSDAYAAIDPHGDAIVSWGDDEEPSSGVFRGSVEAIRRGGGGAFGVPADLSEPNVQDDLPRPAIDAQGDATLVWVLATENPETSKTGYRVQARTLSNTGTLGAVQTLSAFGTLPNEPRIGVDAAGEATTVWTRDTSSSESTEADILPVAGGTFNAPVVLDTADGFFGDDAVAVNEAGEAMAMWTHRASSESEQLVEATRTPGGSFAAAVAVSGDGSEFVGPSLAIDSAGDAASVWGAFSEGGIFVQASNYVVPPPAASGGEATTSSGSTVSATVPTTTSTIPTPPSGQLVVSLRATKPTLVKLRKGAPIKVTCTLTAPGTCSVRLLLSAAAARKLGFHVARHAKTVTIGSVSISLSAAGAKVAALKLSSSALRTIKHDRRPLSVELSATARATNGLTATAQPLALSVH